MPSTVQLLFNKTNLTLGGKVKWGESIPCNSPGVYVVSTSPNLDFNQGSLLAKAPLDKQKIQGWITRVPRLNIDNASPTVDTIYKRLCQFWLPDESIVYIGKAGTSLKKRVGQFYVTPLGEKRPHAGGHWIKTLNNINQLTIYWSCTPNPEEKEDELLEQFILNVSPATRSILFDSSRPFPFANLEYPQGNRKAHGLKNQVDRD